MWWFSLMLWLTDEASRGLEGKLASPTCSVLVVLHEGKQQILLSLCRVWVCLLPALGKKNPQELRLIRSCPVLPVPSCFHCRGVVPKCPWGAPAFRKRGCWGLVRFSPREAPQGGHGFPSLLFWLLLLLILSFITVTPGVISLSPLSLAYL